MELYWLLRLPILHTFCDVTFFILFVFLAIIFFAFFAVKEIDDEQEVEFEKFVFKIACIGIIITSLGIIFVPDKEQLALMLGWDAIKSDSVQEVIEILKNKIGGQ